MHFIRHTQMQKNTKYRFLRQICCRSRGRDRILPIRVHDSCISRSDAPIVRYLINLSALTSILSALLYQCPRIHAPMLHPRFLVGPHDFGFQLFSRASRLRRRSPRAPRLDATAECWLKADQRASLPVPVSLCCLARAA